MPILVTFARFVFYSNVDPRPAAAIGVKKRYARFTRTKRVRPRSLLVNVGRGANDRFRFLPLGDVMAPFLFVQSVF